MWAKPSAAPPSSTKAILGCFRVNSALWEIAEEFARLETIKESRRDLVNNPILFRRGTTFMRITCARHGGSLATPNASTVISNSAQTHNLNPLMRHAAHRLSLLPVCVRWLTN